MVVTRKASRAARWTVQVANFPLFASGVDPARKKFPAKGLGLRGGRCEVHSALPPARLLVRLPLQNISFRRCSGTINSSAYAEGEPE